MYICTYNIIMITRKQTIFLNKLIELYGKEPLPSIENIAKDLGYKSKNSVWQYFQTMINQELVQKRKNRYYLSLNLFGINYIEQPVRAGFPSPSEDYQIKKISFDEMLIKNRASTFTISVSGDSMINAGIYEGDIAVIERGLVPNNGDIVLAMVDGGFTLKTFRKNAQEILLEPANKSYKTIKPQYELEIVGVLVGIVRKLK